ncbi:MAG: 2-amino-4-hydroxy-6-hydroxymethyldihydropteridine diphosphokinase [Bifidobacteriaceae bacterium]|jgi:dihydroneopterin aldolase/2-amino-4-hydroxy-6-hydroxymethyldihydropteridine diphosphokinase|nr:2-amino-4-hydroxy-6-hydroxymethyldihydropteridine diphosphokinase [Bifidobacteriaceae bacterium]
MDWVLGSTGEALDVIELTGITAFGHHGALPEERRNGQIFRADLRLHVDFKTAAETDDLSDAVDYSEVARLVAGILAGKPYNLLETVAAQIAETVLRDGRIDLVEVAVHKPQAFLGVEAGDVSVRLRRGKHIWRESVFVSPDSSIFDAVGEAERREVLAEQMDAALDRVAAAELVGPPLAASPGAEVAGPAAGAAPGRDEAAVNGVGAAEPGSAQAGQIAGEGEPVAASAALTVAPKDAAPEGGQGARASSRSRRRRRPGPAWGPVASVDQIPAEPADAIIALGANLGEALATLRAALNNLREEPGIDVVTVSPLARTAPVGYEDQPDFFNAVAHVRTTLSPRALLHTLQGIEEKHGRQRTVPGGPRTLDLDLIAYDTLLADEEELTLPHPRAHGRAFVLVPWSLMAPGAFLPGLGGGPVEDLARFASDRGRIRWLAPDWDRPARAQGADAAAPSAAEPGAGAGGAGAPGPPAPPAPSQPWERGPGSFEGVGIDRSAARVDSEAPLAPAWAPVPSQPIALGLAPGAEPLGSSPPDDAASAQYAQAGPGMPGFFTAARLGRSAFRGLGSADLAELDPPLVPVPYQLTPQGPPGVQIEAQFQPTMFAVAGAPPMPSRRPRVAGPAPEPSLDARPPGSLPAGGADQAGVLMEPGPLAYAGAPDLPAGAPYDIPAAPLASGGTEAPPTAEPLPGQSVYWVTPGPAPAPAEV